MSKLGDWLKDKVEDVKNAVQNAGGSAQDVLNAAKLAPLIPFKQVMKNALQRKGIPVSNDLQDIAVKFKDYIVDKKSNYEEENYGAELQYLDPATLTIIVGAVLAWFKKKQDEKEAGKPLSAEDSQTLAEANQAAAQVPTEGGMMDGKNWMVWAGVALAVILVIYFVSRKK